MVSPSGNVLWTRDPDVILQLQTHHSDFVEPTDMFVMLDIYGPTITASGGDEQFTYRKIASSFVNENTHNIVWTETVSQAKSMLRHRDYKGGVAPDVASNPNRFALHFPSKAFFNRPETWHNVLTKPPRHRLSYPEAISVDFKRNNTISITPRPVLNMLILFSCMCVR
ncbi:unnamed protein product [Periconia digitata]|uniref:Uncharacterized protein n=1 Tax=Periconia digitata TaxID=1303443 RepID=A0A9W4XEX9_9PLEO|nr:unnamed protein product [Periconia digitata]